MCSDNCSDYFPISWKFPRDHVTTTTMMMMIVSLRSRSEKKRMCGIAYAERDESRERCEQDWSRENLVPPLFRFPVEAWPCLEIIWRNDCVIIIKIDSTWEIENDRTEEERRERTIATLVLCFFLSLILSCSHFSTLIEHTYHQSLFSKHTDKKQVKMRMRKEDWHLQQLWYPVLIVFSSTNSNINNRLEAVHRHGECE